MGTIRKARGWNTTTSIPPHSPRERFHRKKVLPFCPTTLKLTYLYLHVSEFLSTPISYKDLRLGVPYRSRSTKPTTLSGNCSDLTEQLSSLRSWEDMTGETVHRKSLEYTGTIVRRLPTLLEVFQDTQHRHSV